jgi:hypothetical protein
MLGGVFARMLKAKNTTTTGHQEITIVTFILLSLLLLQFNQKLQKQRFDHKIQHNKNLTGVLHAHLNHDLISLLSDTKAILETKGNSFTLEISPW